MSNTAAPIDSRTRTVHIVGFVTAGGTGGFEWRDTEPEALAALAGLEFTPADDATVRAIDVPSRLRGDQLTRWLDRRPELWEPPERQRSPRHDAAERKDLRSPPVAQSRQARPQ